MAHPLLAIRDLVTEMGSSDGRDDTASSGKGGGLRAVDGVSLDVHSGEIVGVVGESGSGKTATALSLLDLLGDSGRVVAGRFELDGRVLESGERAGLRGGDVAMVFQEPLSALNPVRRVGGQVAEAAALHGELPRREARARALELLRQVRLDQPEQRIDAYPHELSGGMRQRVMIAMALAGEPRLLIADEPTTALDATVASAIAALLLTLARDLELAVLLITHDLALAQRLCDRLYVLYAGQVVEHGAAEALLSAPRHPYTGALLSARPQARPGRPRAPLQTIAAARGEPRDEPGCRFAPRCDRRTDECEAPSGPSLTPVARGGVEPGELERSADDAGEAEGLAEHVVRCLHPLQEPPC